MATEKRLIDAYALKANFPVLGNFVNDLYPSGVVRRAIDNAPTVDAVEVVHGRWNAWDGDPIWQECSACGYRIQYTLSKDCKYCPNCGAKMDGGCND